MGGHAFMQPGEAGTIDEHEKNAAKIATLLMTLVERNYYICVTHGNGPQVGSLLLQQEIARSEVPPLPLDVLVAMTEGSLGYMMQQALLNELRKRQMKRYVVTVVTQVVVDENDPAFQAPSKPIGPFLTREEAERRRDQLGWKVKEPTVNTASLNFGALHFAGASLDEPDASVGIPMKFVSSFRLPFMSWNTDSA